MIHIAVMGLISSHNQNNIAEGGVRRQPPVINSNGRSRNILNVAFVQLLQELGVGMDSFFLEVPHHAMSEFGGDNVAKEVSIQENTLDSNHQSALIPPGLCHLHECHEMHPLVFSLVK